MKLSLIICTYKRPESLKKLLDSIITQTYYPDEILIIDGSDDNATNEMLANATYSNLNYFLVPEAFRGLTKQRNFGIQKVNPNSEIIAFLDDDTELLPRYFSELRNTFLSMPEVSGVGGVAINENAWFTPERGKHYDKNQYYRFEDFIVKEGQRNVFRNRLGLESDLGPGRMPEYSHGRTCGFPLNGKTYEVDLLIGMSFAFRKVIFESIKFSTFFEGYGLYEDADFSIRAQRFGKNVINTKLQLFHFHHPSGRPNQYKYGKMVVRNGWYVWRIKNANPSINAKVKWNLITLLLTLIRFMNTFTTNSRKEAFTEALGRTVGWWSLLFDKPKLQK